MCLLFKIQTYLRRTGMPETKFGRLAVNDPRLVGDLRRGRCPGARMTARVERFMMTGQRGEPGRNLGSDLGSHLGRSGRKLTPAGLPTGVGQ